MNIRDLSLSVADALLRSGLEGAHEPTQRPAKPAFTITISREVGALGLKTAAEVGKRLGWPVYDQGLLARITEELGREIPHFERMQLDERHVSWLEEFFTNLGGGPAVTPTMYLKKLVGVVQGLGKMGNCIIVGRGANCILPPATTVRVRLVANLPDRVSRMARILEMTEAEAARHIASTDHGRTEFVKNNFGKDPTDPHEYDLVINTSSVSVEKAAEMIVAALRTFDKRSEVTANVPEHAAVGAG